AVDGDRGRELAAGDDVLAGGVDVDAVRRLGRGQEVDEPLAGGRVEDRGGLAPLGRGDAGGLVDLVVRVPDGHLGGQALGDALLGAAPVHGRDEVLVGLRRVDLEERVGFLDVVG